MPSRSKALAPVLAPADICDQNPLRRDIFLESWEEELGQRNLLRLSCKDALINTAEALQPEHFPITSQRDR